MNRQMDREANDRRRNEAARIIAEHARFKQTRDTNERLLDQDALRQASIRAGLETPEVGDD